MASMMTNSMFTVQADRIKELIREEMNNLHGFDEDMGDYDDGENEDTSEVDVKHFYYDVAGLYRNTNRVDYLKNLILEIDRLSWALFEENKICGANCINIYSPKVARIFDMVNTLTDNIKFINKSEYTNTNSYLIGELNNKYKVYMPKRMTRVVMSEKRNAQTNSEEFIKDKNNMIEIFNSEIPAIKFSIKLENLQ